MGGASLSFIFGDEDGSGLVSGSLPALGLYGGGLLLRRCFGVDDMPIEVARDCMLRREEGIGRASAVAVGRDPETRLETDSDGGEEDEWFGASVKI